jgi:hypothetical protein
MKKGPKNAQLEGTHSTLVFRGTPFEKHCFRESTKNLGISVDGLATLLCLRVIYFCLRDREKTGLLRNWQRGSFYSSGSQPGCSGTINFYVKVSGVATNYFIQLKIRPVLSITGI